MMLCYIKHIIIQFTISFINSDKWNKTEYKQAAVTGQKDKIL